MQRSMMSVSFGEMERLDDIPSVNYSYVFGFEETFPFRDTHQWILENLHYSFYIAGIYVIAIYIGPKFMKNRPKYELRGALILWNFLLAGLSFWGTMRTLPELVYLLREYGFITSVCDGGYVLRTPICSMWTWVFAILKVVELGDTAFVVFRKQELIFLHWFHHVTSLLSVWYSYAMAYGAGRWVVVMNYIIHTIMYFYYALRACRVRIPRKMAMSLTLLQMIQFVIGMCAGLRVVIALLRNEPCHSNILNAIICPSVYISNLLLFFYFFRNAYLRPKSRVKAE